MGGVVRAVAKVFGASAPSAPPPPPPPPAPNNTEADEIARKQAAQGAGGKTSTMLTGGQGLLDTGTTSKTLLGN